MRTSTIVAAIAGATMTVASAIPLTERQLPLCLGINSNAECCATDVLGLADLDCAPRKSLEKSTSTGILQQHHQIHAAIHYPVTHTDGFLLTPMNSTNPTKKRRRLPPNLRRYRTKGAMLPASCGKSQLFLTSHGGMCRYEHGTDFNALSFSSDKHSFVPHRLD